MGKKAAKVKPVKVKPVKVKPVKAKPAPKPVPAPIPVEVEVNVETPIALETVTLETPTDESLAVTAEDLEALLGAAMPTPIDGEP